MSTVQEFDAAEFAAPKLATAGFTAPESPVEFSGTPGAASATEHDERAVASVLATLRQQFPEADPRTVESLVDRGFAEFGGAKVTTYVPVLVLHACQDQLRGA